MGKRSRRQVSNFIVGQNARIVILCVWKIQRNREWRFTYSVVVVGGTTGTWVKRKSNACRSEQSANPATHVQNGSHSV